MFNYVKSVAVFFNSFESALLTANKTLTFDILCIIPPPQQPFYL